MRSGLLATMALALIWSASGCRAPAQAQPSDAGHVIDAGVDVTHSPLFIDPGSPPASPSNTFLDPGVAPGPAGKDAR
jgi:hypothetical protein